MLTPLTAANRSKEICTESQSAEKIFFSFEIHVHTYIWTSVWGLGGIYSKQERHPKEWFLPCSPLTSSSPAGRSPSLTEWPHIFSREFSKSYGEPSARGSRGRSQPDRGYGAAGANGPQVRQSRKVTETWLKEHPTLREASRTPIYPHGRLGPVIVTLNKTQLVSNLHLLPSRGLSSPARTWI